MFTKIVLILAGLAVLIRSAPLPACLWDEAVEGTFANSVANDDSGTHDKLLAQAADFRTLTDAGDDTPEQILHDLLLHQSMGTLHQASVEIHHHYDCQWWTSTGSIFSARNLIARKSAFVSVSPPYPPSPPGIQSRPLLI